MVEVRAKTAPPAAGTEGRMCLNRVKIDDAIALTLMFECQCVIVPAEQPSRQRSGDAPPWKWQAGWNK